MATNEVEMKPKIPVVGHVITDDDLGIKKGVKLQPISFSNVIKLLTDPHSATLHNRHVHALQRLVNHYQHGFLLKDLVQVFKVLNVMADRVSEYPLYLTPMINILKLCSLPFLRQKSSDESIFSQISVESLSQIAYLVRVPNKEVRKQLADTLLNIYTTDPPNVEFQDLVPVTRAFNIEQVNLSDIAETLTKSLPLFEVDLEVKISFLDVLQHLSSFSPVNCQKMISVDGISRILGRLNDQEPSGKLLYRSIEILLNLLEYGKGEEVAKQINSFICISALRDAFLAQMTQGYSHYDRQLRNDLLVLVSLAESHCPYAPFIESGFAKQLILFATFQEVRSHNMLVKHLKLSTNHEDFELKKLLMSVVVVLSKEPAMIPLLVEGHFLLALLSYIRNNEETSQPQEWSPAQFEELQLHAMTSLCTIAPQCVQDYMSYQGNTRLLLLLEWCVGKDDYGGHGNSYHATGGRGNKRAQMRYCMHLMRSMVSLADEACNQDLVDQGAISQLLDILSSASKSTFPDDEVDVEMQCDMLFILSALCEGELHRKELFGSKGVEAVVQYLQVNAKKVCNGLGHHRLMVACVDCIWSCVIGSSINEDVYLAGEGVFLLLNLLQNCPADMYNLILGCLVDLCENPKSVSHMMAWRGIENRTACNLLVDVWRKEEDAIGVKRDANGCIADSVNPLMGALQSEDGVQSQPADSSSRAILDVFENLRAKIYSLFCKIEKNKYITKQKSKRKEFKIQ
ncbi:cilia- and flagella-associated protein 69-like isoform X2 [Antedon mediterranea]|uniref:cilia- and flagella-associated protein 69-like isoform X2 n=1 Tax=Antedon mediterranea TaxID=105859 RepID=UPI003AF912B0